MRPEGRPRMYLVVGATGSLGGQIAKKLLAAGERVRIVERDSNPVREQNPHTDPRELIAAGAETVRADLREPGSLAEAVRGVDVVVSTASGTKRAPPDTTAAVDGEGTANLARAAARAGVRRFVLVSAAGADPNAPEGLFRDKPEDVQVTREMEDAAYALYGVAPVAALPAEAYVVRVRAVVIRSG